MSNDEKSSNKPKRAVFLRSCTQECAEPVKATIEGKIPEWVKGTLIRNGPGLKEIGPDKYKHLFDGPALLHQFTVSNGEVHYRNKFLRSKCYERCMKAQRIVVSDYGTHSFPDPCKSLLGRFMSLFISEELTDNDAVSFFPIGDSIYAVTESNFIHRVNENTLETMERIDVSKYFALHTLTAHPHVDKDGTVYNVGTRFSNKSTYVFVKIPPPADKEDDKKNPYKSFENGRILAEIPASNPSHPSYFHSFCLTENYLVFVEQSVVLSLPSLMFNKFFKKAYGEALQWKPTLTTNFYIISKSDGTLIRKYEADAMCFYHAINGYEDNGHVICDICTYDDGNLVHALFHESLTSLVEEATSGKENVDLRNFKDIGKCLISEARRYVLPLDVKCNEEKEKNLVNLENSTAKAFLKNGVVYLTPEALTASGFNTAELPRINYDYNGLKYRFFYGLTRRENDFQTQLMKHDIEAKESKIWFEDNYAPSEPVFIAKPGADSEDDGVVLSAVLDENNDKHGYLLVLDGKSFELLAKAHFETPSAITPDFHGLFIDG